MKIKNISCTQFAGIRDRDISFEDGINVICGNNESGKSTLVNLLSKVLFQSADIDRRNAVDKEFRSLYFPSAVKGGTSGDFADGAVTFETEKGSFTLSKEWGTDGSCKLSTPYGIIKEQAKISEILREELLYGEGVYSDMLFSSQRNTDISLQTILDASKRTDAKQEIADAVTMAFVESDGVSVDAIEEAINSKIAETEGKHWDGTRNAPVRKAGGGRWTKEVGELLKAYYALEDAKAVLDDLSRLSDDADRSSAKYAESVSAEKLAENDYNEFLKFASRLEAYNDKKNRLAELESNLKKYKKTLGEWAKIAADLPKAERLQREKTDRETLAKYETVRKLAGEVKALKETVDNTPCPSGDEIKSVSTAQRQISALENRLCGMNINAVIKMLGGNAVEVRSLRTGKLIDINGGKASINEAVSITVPNVMEMTLTPANVDAGAVEKLIEDNKTLINGIFGKYNVSDIEALEKLANDIAADSANLSIKYKELQLALGGTAVSELKEAVGAIQAEPRRLEDIESDISELCGRTDISAFIVSEKTVISGFESEYESMEALNRTANAVGIELQKTAEAVNAAEDIPDEYKEIKNSEEHLGKLKAALDSAKKACDEALKAKTSAASRLESFEENTAGDPLENVENAKRSFEEQKTLLAHWKHIAEVFYEKKNALSGSPMLDISNSFAEYLGVISGGKVSSEFPEADKLSMNIYSGNRLLDYGKLSEGTKETVSLAFRLAVLDHLFPDGGGVIVLDDPFTDMDAERTAQSCELIKECAKRHQVIFLTCKDEYANLLGGNTILI